MNLLENVSHFQSLYILNENQPGLSFYFAGLATQDMFAGAASIVCHYGVLGTRFYNTKKNVPSQAAIESMSLCRLTAALTSS